MSLSFLVIGDPHLKIGAMQRTQIMIQQIELQIRALKPDVIVCLGDVLDRFANIRQETLSQATDFFRLLQQYAPVYIIVGNHDRPHNAVFMTTEHPFNAVKYWSDSPHKVHIIDTTYKCSIQSMEFVFVPYVPNGRFVEALEHVQDWRNADLIFAHQDFMHAKYGSMVSTNGDVWMDEYPAVISGHIHDYQEIGSNIIYPGSPIQHAFDESPIKSLMMVSCTKESLQYHRVVLDVPIYWVHRMNIKDVAAYTPPELPRYSDMKIVLQGSSSEIKAMSKIKKIKEWQKMGIKIQPVVIGSERPAPSAVLAQRDSKSFMDLLREHLAERKDLLALF